MKLEPRLIVAGIALGLALAGATDLCLDTSVLSRSRELDRREIIETSLLLPRAPVDLLIRSAGKTSFEEESPYAEIHVGGRDVSQAERGYNLVVVDDATGRVDASVHFDTHKNPEAAGQLARFLRRVPSGKLVVGAVKDEASSLLSEEAQAALRLLGIAKNVGGRYREAHAFVGWKGASFDETPDLVANVPIHLHIEAPWKRKLAYGLRWYLRYLGGFLALWLATGLTLSWLTGRSTACILNRDLVTYLPSLILMTLFGIVWLRGPFSLAVAASLAAVMKIWTYHDDVSLPAIPRWVSEPIEVFVISRFWVVVIAFLGLALLPGEPAPWQVFPENVFFDMWARWDSGYYLDIARFGYPPGPGHELNPAFFPLYPLLSRGIAPLFEWFGFAPDHALVIGAVTISHMSLLVALMYLYRLTLLLASPEAASRTIYYVALFPAAVFFSAVYTESLFLRTATASTYHARRGQWSLAGLWGFLSAMTRLVGVVLLPAHLILYFAGGRRARGWTLMWLLLIPAGTAVFSLVLEESRGDPLAFVSVQENWGRGEGSWLKLVDSYQRLQEGDVLEGEADAHAFLHWSFVLATVLLGVLAGRRFGVDSAVFVLGSMGLPIVTGVLASTPRYSAVLFPCFMVLGEWGRNRFVHRFLSIGFLMGLALFTVSFVNWFSWGI
ncbi:MAG TPA: interleukin-like EMT inducer domain-containing protein [Vicinamibacteria bacterium]|nr:interleukin-like EMT inducer domain-containing protein [Vicinamibacteria bacterium]